MVYNRCLESIALTRYGSKLFRSFVDGVVDDYTHSWLSDFCRRHDVNELTVSDMMNVSNIMKKFDSKIQLMRL